MLPFFRSSARKAEKSASEASNIEALSSWEVVERNDESTMGTEMKTMSPHSMHDSIMSPINDGSPKSKKLETDNTSTTAMAAQSTAKVSARKHVPGPSVTSRLTRSLSAPVMNPFEQFDSDSQTEDFVLVDGETITIHLRGQEVQVWKCAGLECDGTCPPGCPFYGRDLRSKARRTKRRVGEALDDMFAPSYEKDRTTFRAIVTVAGEFADDARRAFKNTFLE
ncbi:hypothetical protein AC578_4731 [Pseudocercospora eumusae]|uniref:Uncharacterized protein n=1 Tax=Pseudocercospora eumusae TaxID=321146 RepID=A0A139GU95_9PEZI|nr:hypothetical protein AC578_4731 [Pseudocercospora eumusae]